LLQITLVCVLYPYFLIAFVVIGFFFVLLDFTMNAGILETKKLDNIMKSPVIHHISSSMAGVTIIRGFGKEAEFKARYDHPSTRPLSTLFRFNQFLNQSMSADCLFRLAQRWFMWRMDGLGLLTITLTGVVVVATKGSVSPAIAGLALATVFQVERTGQGLMIPVTGGNLYTLRDEAQVNVPGKRELPGEDQRVHRPASGQPNIQVAKGCHGHRLGGAPPSP
jgi:ABC-type multidrug transport system fused ATPase/permease subunit